MTTKTTKTATLRSLSVKADTVFAVRGDVECGKLIQQSDTENREKVWSHAGLLARSMRAYGDMDTPERWVELTTVITFYRRDDGLDITTDGGHRSAAMILAHGNHDDWAWLCQRYPDTLMKTKDGETTPDVDKLARMAKLEPLDQRTPTEKCPRFILSIETDRHYFNVADQDARKRTGADTLTTTTDIGNALANVELPASIAQTVLRMVYLRCHRSVGSANYGSVKRGGNMNASRYPGYYAVIGKAMLAAWKKYNELVSEFTKRDNACNVDNLKAIGVANILTVMTLAELSKTPGKWLEDGDHEPTKVEKQTEYLNLMHYDETTIRDGLFGLLVAHLDRHSTGGLLLLECQRKVKRIGLDERIAAICSVLGYASIEQKDAQPWNEIFCHKALSADRMNKLIQAEELPQCEQIWGLRWYGPDSTGWRQSDRDKMEQAATGKVKTKRPRKAKSAK